MIWHEDIDRAQIPNGYYTIGTGPKIVFILGSCRCLAYLNYFIDLNASNEFTLIFIDPFRWKVHDGYNDETLKVTLDKCEHDDRILNAIQSSHWFIHEHYVSYGMFNTERILSKNIYEFGIKPELDITIPNFESIYILFSDVLDKNEELLVEAESHMASNGYLSVQLQNQIADKGLEEVERACRIFELLSDFPEMGRKFRYEWRNTKFFHTTHHVSSQFNVAIFSMMIGKLPGLKVPESMWDKWLSEDMFSSPCTPVTKYDVDNYALKWNIPLSPLVLPLP